MIGSAQLIRMFGKPCTILRQCKEGTYINGRWTPTEAEKEIQIIASIQPMDGKTLQMLPEGERTAEMRKLFTTTKLLTVQEVGQKNADTILVDGCCWEVQRVEQWDPLLGHYKAIISRMNRQE
jgi:hypothetical protein